MEMSRINSRTDLTEVGVGVGGWMWVGWVWVGEGVGGDTSSFTHTHPPTPSIYQYIAMRRKHVTYRDDR
jgi:hypothetical protein